MRIYVSRPPFAGFGKHHESQFDAHLAWKCAKSDLRRLILGLFETRPGNVPKLASEGSFWAFLSLGLECDKSNRRRLISSLFETTPWKCAKTCLRRHILSLFIPGPGNVPKWSQKPHFEPFWVWTWNAGNEVGTSAGNHVGNEVGNHISPCIL